MPDGTRQALGAGGEAGEKSFPQLCALGETITVNLTTGINWLTSD